MRQVGESLSRIVMVGFVAAAVLVAAAGTARASQRMSFEVQPATTAGFVDLGKIDGYRAGLYLPTERVAIFYVSRSKVTRQGKGALFSYAYAVRTRRSLAQGVIRARFGSLGAFSLRFRPNGRVRKDEPRRGCGAGRRSPNPDGSSVMLRFSGKVTTSTSRSRVSREGSPGHPVSGAREVLRWI